jgi:predicted thioredoxin/glutaredoxin
MKNFFITNLILSTLLYFSLIVFSNTVKANDYNTAVIGHVITQKITGQPIDTSKLMEQELSRAAHSFAIDSISILQKYLPNILDKIATELRLEADKNYKSQKDGT